MQMAMAVGAKLMAGATAAGGAISSGAGSVLASAKGLFGLGGAAGGAGAMHTGVANVAGAASGGGGLLGKLSTATTALSAFSSFAGGMADRRLAEEQALEARYGATNALIRGQQESNAILDKVVDDLARKRVAYAAAGLDTGSTSARASLRDIARDGEADIDIAQSDALSNYLISRRSMKNIKRRGGSAGLSGLAQAAATIGKGAIDLKRRG